MIKKKTKKAKISSSTPCYIAYDVETGGLTLEHSLLSAYFAITNEAFEVLDSLELLVKPDQEQPYVVSARALEVNGIELTDHDKKAISYSAAGELLYAFIQKHTTSKSRLVALGHNITSLEGDTAFIWKYLLPKKKWLEVVSIKCEDTLVIAQFLKAKGILPANLSLSLGSLAKHFNIPFINQHTASADTLCTLEIRKRF